ncbi:hypothetical protein E4U17_003112 [Claviceps sp. LM77 group G4]|nr:hypothetical protein E4U17_003112 [Claviceps sp. LM77 group G4]KAG6063706.1 hypothetical protein E4U33_006280 [Claviceps sp. LM78 group G4]KAG6071155.1 hypothetical protein E4U16_006315 [Claviceps sp. LM84 group G4]
MQASKPPREIPDCPLCGSNISRVVLDNPCERWKSSVQYLDYAPPSRRPSTDRHDDGGRMPLVASGTMDKLPPPSHEARVVHAACWAIMTKVWGTSAFTKAELEGFVACARCLAPFLPGILFQESPGELDEDIDYAFADEDLDADELYKGDLDADYLDDEEEEENDEEKEGEEMEDEEMEEEEYYDEMDYDEYDEYEDYEDYEDYDEMDYDNEGNEIGAKEQNTNEMAELARKKEAQARKLLSWDETQQNMKQELLRPPSLIGLFDRALPPPAELESFVARTLNHVAEVRHNPDPDLRFWAGVIVMLTNSPASQFAKSAPSRASSITRALRNLHLGSLQRFPHTANFDVVRSNALSILTTLLPIPVGDMDEDSTYELVSTMRSQLTRRRAISLRDISYSSDRPFRLAFYTIRRPRAEKAIQRRGVSVGRHYLRFIDFNVSRTVRGFEIAPRVNYFCGLRFIRDEVGVVGLDVLDGNDWVHAWEQDCSERLDGEEGGMKRSVAEWDPRAENGHLTIVADAVKDLSIAVIMHRVDA